MEPQMNADAHRYKSKAGIRVLSVCICVHLWLIAFSFPVFAHAQEMLTVAVASSLYPTMQQRAATFEKAHDISIRLIPGSTGRLYNQIIQGAPFDIFIAADDERPRLLANQGKVVARFDAGQGYLGIVIGNHASETLGQLDDPSIHHIVIANPDVAPFGKVSKALLQKQGLWQVLKPKFVYAQNAMQAAMMVRKKLVDAGLVPVSDKNKALAEVPYIAVLLSNSKRAYQFCALLGSEALASPEQHSQSATKVASPTGREALASPNDQ